jgi:hypothetical protein
MSFVLYPLSFVASRLSHVFCPSKLERQFLLSHVARLLSKKTPPKKHRNGIENHHFPEVFNICLEFSFF